MIRRLASNLPAPRISLIGRDADAAAVRDLVVHGRERLVTLTGVGGCGKTSLALQVASELREAFPDGAYLVELAPLSDPVLVPEAFASVLGIHDLRGSETFAALASFLQPRTILLVLDNCEHLINACASAVDRLLASCPELRVLATSREPLQIAGERQLRVQPLGLPEGGEAASLDEMSRSPAIQLFAERAIAVAPAFRLTPENASAVVRICTLLAGIPLALELAAARVRVLSITQIAQRLDDCFRLLAGNSRSAPTRQQTLKATLDWSYDLLSRPERMVFRRLSVFAGSCGLDAAEAVCSGGEVEGVDVLELLTRLLDRSLVVAEEQAGEARYRMLEPVRQYSARLLAESGELPATRDRLADFYVDLAEQLETELLGPDQAYWLSRLDGELDNIRAVIAWAEESGNPAITLRVAGALHWFLWMRRHLREGQRWLEAALARAEPASPRAKVKGLMAAAMVCSFLGEYPKGQVHGRAALDIYRQLGDAIGLAGTTITLSHIYLSQGDLPAARSLAEESVGFARESGSRWHLGQALVVLGQILHEQGHTTEAIGLHGQAVAIFREQGDQWGTRYAMTNLASLQQNRPDIIRATALSSVQLYWEQGDHLSLAAALEYLAGRGETGQLEKRVRLLAAADALRKALVAPPPLTERDDIQKQLALARAALGEARFALAWREGAAMSLEMVMASLTREEPATDSPEPLATKSRGVGPSDKLTRREREIAVLLARGYTDRQIAEELTITEGTAGIHVYHILQKLGFRSRVQVADWAVAHGLIERSADR